MQFILGLKMQVLDCSVSGGVAKITDNQGNEISIPDAVLQCAGVFSSKGKLIISESGAVYIVDTQPDVKFLLEQMKAIADQISSLSTSLVSRSPDTAPLSPSVTQEIALIKSKLDDKELI